MSFEASVRYAGDIAIVDMTGRIVLNDGSAALREAIAKLCETGASKILLNLADVTFIDSSGLGELASAYARMSKDGGQLKLMNLPARIVDLLRITKLNTVLIAFPSEPAALQSFNNGAVSA